MTDLEKLRHLLEHWIEHNDEHSKTYLEWSKKAGAAGKTELSAALKEIAEKTLGLNKLFNKARHLCK